MMDPNLPKTVLLIISAAAAVSVLYCSAGSDNRQLSANEILFTRPKLHLSRDLLVDPPSSWLFDLRPFYYIMSTKACEKKIRKNRLSFAIIIHSKPEHFRQRQSIRQTWASATNTRAVFVLGKPASSPQTKWRPNTWALIEAEHKKHGDLIQGNFIDTYQNLTYKHVMALKWASDNCQDVDYVIKADDDAFVDIFQLEQFLTRTFDTPPQDTLLCNVVPENTNVLRSGKYSVSEAQFKWKTYPKFCSGLAYVMTPSLARKLYQASPYVGFLSIDDVYVTGLLAEALSVKHFYLNLRYNYEDVHARANSTRFIFTELNTTLPDWRKVAETLWKSNQLS